MARRVGKEGKDGSTRLRPKWEKKLFRKEGCAVKIEWSEWVGCSRLAIVPVFFGLLPQRVPLGCGGRHDEMLRECSKHEGVYKTEHDGSAWEAR